METFTGYEPPDPAASEGSGGWAPPRWFVGSLAVEVKLANTVTDSDTKHLHWLAERMGDKLLDAIVINTGPNAYRRPDGIAVVPLGLLAP